MADSQSSYLIVKQTSEIEIRTFFKKSEKFTKLPLICFWSALESGKELRTFCTRNGAFTWLV